MTTTAFVPGTRMTPEEYDAMLSKMSPEELRLHSWYAQFPNGEELQLNYRIHCDVSKAISECDVRKIAHALQRAIANRAWEQLPEYPGNEVFGKVEHLSFIQWVEGKLHRSPSELVRVLSGHLPDPDEAGAAVLCVIDEIQAEDPDTLRSMLRKPAEANLPSLRQVVDSKAEQCNGKWTQVATHLSDITAGKVGGHNPKGTDGKFTVAPSGGASDDTKSANRTPKSERERQRIRYRGLKDNPAKCAELGITTEGAQAAFDAMCNSVTIPLAEVARIAGFKENPRKRIELAGALDPAKVAAKLLDFFGRDKAAAIAAALTEALTQ
jgi:hypothetical protein